MVRTIATHSYKGGTGKTMITMNLAVQLVLSGQNVVVLDLDLTAPSIQSFVPHELRKDVPTVNSALTHSTPIRDCLIDMSSVIGNDGGKLYVILADTDTESIIKVTRRNVKEYSEDASKIFKWIKELEEDIDYLIIDTSPGMSFTSVNCVAASDITIVLLRLMKADFHGTQEMINGMHARLGAPILLAINQVPVYLIEEQDEFEQIQSIIEEQLLGKIDHSKITLSTIIPRDDTIITQEVEALRKKNNSEQSMIALIQPDSIFSSSVRRLKSFVTED